MKHIDMNEIRFNEQGFVPVIIQDIHSGTVLMLAYMNEESLKATVKTGETHFWSRSRQVLWHKGETSGHVQKVKSITRDCDGDALLIRVEQVGNACHTGTYSCFSTSLHGTNGNGGGAPISEVLGRLASVIHQRKIELPEGSYTAKLFQAGLDRILKKIGEEAGEVIIAAKNKKKDELSWEAADLLYHLLVLLEEAEVPLESVAEELGRRAVAKQKKEGEN